jgi:hypothetical protein
MNWYALGAGIVGALIGLILLWNVFYPRKDGQ